MNIIAANSKTHAAIVSTLPTDLITTVEARKLAGVTSNEWACAKKYRPEDFPKNHGKGFYRFPHFSAAEVTAFFSRFKK